MSRRALRARFPSRRRIRAVQRYLRARGAVNSWSLIDSWGRVHGFAPHRVYVSASLVKAMLLTSYLRGIGNRMPDAAERALLGPMITVSSNDAADTIYYRVGDAALYRLAKAVGMKSFSVAGYWANAHFSAEDQARFFNRIDRLIPARSRGYARGLLSSIVSYQRWGFSRYAGAAGFRTFFKGGWRGTGLGQLVHEAALFERRRHALLDGGAHRRQPVARVRHRDASGSGAAGVPGRVRRGDARDEPGLGGTPATRRAGLVDVHKLRAEHPGEPLLPHQAQRDGQAVARLLRELGADARAGRVQPRPGAAIPAPRNDRGLLVLDAYRPVRATEALVRWAERTGRGGAVGTYIARRSRHNTGSAVDITLVRDSDGKRLRMGGFAFGPCSHTYNASGRILATGSS